MSTISSTERRGNGASMVAAGGARARKRRFWRVGAVEQWQSEILLVAIDDAVQVKERGRRLEGVLSCP